MNITKNNVAVCGLGWHASWCAEQGLIHDRWYADQCCRHIQPGDLCINIGAHIGTLTAAMIEAGASVVAFEPNQEARECLEYNCPTAEIFPYAIGDAHFNMDIVRSDNAGASFLVPGTGIDVRPLDSFGLAPNFILMDCEGWEARALEGAKETIERHQPVLILEMNRNALSRIGDTPESIYRKLEQFGYSYQIVQPELVWSDEQFDILCLPKNYVDPLNKVGIT